GGEHRGRHPIPALVPVERAGEPGMDPVAQGGRLQVAPAEEPQVHVGEVVAVLGGGEQAIDELLLLFRVGVADVDRRRLARRQLAGEVERDAAEERAVVGGGRGRDLAVAPRPADRSVQRRRRRGGGPRREEADQHQAGHRDSDPRAGVQVKMSYPGSMLHATRSARRPMKIASPHNLRLTTSEEEAEFDWVETVGGIGAALAAQGHEVEKIEVSGPASSLVSRLEASDPDLIFNTAEGRRGRAREAFYPA